MSAKEKKIIRLSASGDLAKAVKLVEQVFVLVAFTQVLENKSRIRVKDAEKGMPLSFEFNDKSHKGCERRRLLPVADIESIDKVIPLGVPAGRC